MGNVIGSSDSHTFWEEFIDVYSFFGLNSKCINCTSETTLFGFNTSTGFFEVIGNNEHVDDLLNDEAVNQHFGMVWTNELELVDKLMLEVSVSGLLTGSFLVESGTPLGDVDELSPFFNDDGYGVVSEKNQTRVVLDRTNLVSRNMSLIVGKWVNVFVGAPFNYNMKLFGAHQLDKVSQLFGFALDDFIVVDTNIQVVLNKSSMIERNTVLMLCHNVSAHGLLDKSWIVEHGTKLGMVTELSGFWNNQFTIINTTNSGQIFTKETEVLNDMTMNINKNSRVVIEITPTEEVNTSEVIKTITDIIGDDSSIVSVDVVLDEEGKVAEIIIIVEDESSANTIVEVINGIDTGTGCSGGVLCSKRNAYVEGNTPSCASISFLSTTLLLLSFILLNHFF